MRLTRRRSPLPLFFSSSSSAMVRSFSPYNNGSVSDPSDKPPENTVFLRRSIAALVFLTAFFFVYNSIFDSSSPPSLFSSSSSSISFVSPADDNLPFQDNEEYTLERVLKNAATEDKTVIITTLNEAWASPNSIIDLFLESFRLGHQTRRLLNHLVIVALDDKAFKRCMVLHPYCFALVTEGVDFSKEAYFMTPDYLKMMWRRIDFLRSVLEMGYNFVFTANGSTIKGDVLRMFSEFNHSGKIVTFLNGTFLNGIPKKVNVEDISDYVPISLVGCMYKLLSKVLARRLRGVMGGLISDSG